MGVMRRIGIIVFLFFCLQVVPQNSPDTVYFSGKKFVKHIVQAGESLKSIAMLHNVQTLEIKQANELNRRLFYNQVLYIPIYLNYNKEDAVSVKELILGKENVDTGVVDIALLLPYYLLNNEAFDTLDTYYNKSELALSFHVGVELAVDSLRRAGKKIVVHTFDTNRDSTAVSRIVASNKLDRMDIIIGPMYSSLFQIICEKYGQDNTKILISPLSRDNQSITKYPSVYQISLTYKVQADILTSYLIEKKLGERIIILNDSKEDGLATYLKHKFKMQNKTVESYQITHTKVDSIRRYFVEAQNVLLLSKDKAFISTMLGSIGSIDSLSTVFSFESIVAYENLDITNLMELDVHIPNSRSINFSNNYDLDFVSLFEREYGTNIRKYSKVGYDIIMHFCGSSNIFTFQQYKTGYYENISALIYHYFDYELVPVN